MARLAITLHRLHGKDHFEVVTGPEVPIQDHLTAVKTLAHAGKENAEIAEAQVWSSSEGMRKRFKFRKPGERATEEVTDETKPAKAAKAAKTPKTPKS